MCMYCNVCEDPLLSAHLLKQAVPHQQHHGRESLSAVDNGGSPLGPPQSSSLRWPSSVCSWAGTWRMRGSAGPYWGGGGGPRRAASAVGGPFAFATGGAVLRVPRGSPPAPLSCSCVPDFSTHPIPLQHPPIDPRNGTRSARCARRCVWGVVTLRQPLPPPVSPAPCLPSSPLPPAPPSPRSPPSALPTLFPQHYVRVRRGLALGPATQSPPPQRHRFWMRQEGGGGCYRCRILPLRLCLSLFPGCRWGA